MPDPLHVSEMLCARLCHDLSGPLGSLLGATELAVEQGEGSEAILLASETALTLGRRLRFFRAAWAGDANPMSVSEIQELAAGIGTGRRVKLDFSGLDPAGVFAPADARVLLNVVLLAVESIAGDGSVAVAGAAGADMVVTIDGPRAAWPAGLAACLADDQAAWDALTSARSLQVPLTALIASRAGLRVSILLPTGISPGSAPPLLVAPSPKH